MKNMKASKLNKAPWYRISIPMIPCKLSYFLLLSKEFVFKMNIVLFLVSIGLTKSQAGLIAGIRLLFVMIGGPIFAMMADKYLIHRYLIALITLVSSCCTITQPLLAYRFGTKSFAYCGQSGSSAQTIFNQTITNVSLSITTTTPTLQYFSNNDQTILFYILLCLNCFQSFFEGGLDAFIDLGVMLRIQQSNARDKTNHKFGIQRLFGEIGTAVGPIIGNEMIEIFSWGDVSCYSVIFIIHLVFLVSYGMSLLWLMHGLDQKPTPENACAENEEALALGNEVEVDTIAPTDEPQNLLKDLYRTLRQPEMMMLFFSLFLSGCFFSMYLTFIYPYMKDLEATSLELNFYAISFFIGGVLGFIFSNKMIRFVGGPFKALFLCTLSWIIRLAGVSVTNEPFAVAALQIIQAFNHPITETVCCHFIMDHSPKQVLTTMYGLVNALQYNLTDVAVGPLGGYIYDVYGGKTLFYGFAVAGSIIFRHAYCLDHQGTLC